MTPTEVLKMLKSKIDAAGLNKCNYTIETSDIEAINQALSIHDDAGLSEQLNCDHEWIVEAFDCYGMPYEQHCEHCGKKEAF